MIRTQRLLIFWMFGVCAGCALFAASRSVQWNARVREQSNREVHAHALALESYVSGIVNPVSRSAAAVEIDAIKERAIDEAMRAEVDQAEAGVPEDADVKAPVVLLSDQDNEMFNERQGLVGKTVERRKNFEKLPESIAKTTAAIIKWLVPGWVWWCIYVVAGGAVVSALGFFWQTFRARSLKLGLVRMVKVSDGVVSKDDLHKATSGTKAQKVYRKLRDDGELGGDR